MLASATDDPALLNPGDLADSVNTGRNVCTNGPFVKVKITGDAGEIASHGLADDLIATASGGSATVQVDVQSPTWAEYDRIDIYVNNVPSCGTTPPPNFVGGVKTVCTPNTVTAGKYFSLTPTVNTVAINGDFRLESSSTQALTITDDSWVVVVVRGLDNVSKPLFPMNPQSILAKACTGDPCKSCRSNGDCSPFWGTCNVRNETLAQLTNDGNLGQCGVLSLAIANPLFIDRDGDGLYKGVTLP